MICERIATPAGAAIICSHGRRKRCACGRPPGLLCDWKVPKRRSGTCDAPICANCTTQPAPDKDLCPAHAKDYAAWKATATVRSMTAASS